MNIDDMELGEEEDCRGVELDHPSAATPMPLMSGGTDDVFELVNSEEPISNKAPTTKQHSTN